jgi:non-ribosomal peptide synthetase component F
MVVLRTHLGGDPTGREALRRVRATTLAAYANQDVPWEEVARAVSQDAGIKRTSPCQVMLVLQNAIQRRATPSTSGFASTDWNTPIPAVAMTTFDLVVMVRERPEGIEATCLYPSDLFAPATIESMLGDFGGVLERLVEAPERVLSALGPLPPP